MLWWGRIGKLTQFTGGLVTIIDVIGSDRLRRQTFVATLRHSRSIYRQMFGDVMDDGQRWANSRPGSPGYGQWVVRRTLSAEAQRVRRLVRIGFGLLVAAGPVWAIWPRLDQVGSAAELVVVVDASVDRRVTGAAGGVADPAGIRADRGVAGVEPGGARVAGGDVLPAGVAAVIGAQRTAAGSVAAGSGGVDGARRVFV